jgi:type IV secretory pathway TraG/TraD family ATPase VirD4
MVKQSSSVASIEFGRPLLLPSEINRLPSDQEIIFINGMYPILTHKIRYFSDQRYSNKIKEAAIIQARPLEPKQKPINEVAPVVESKRVTGSAL